MISSISFQSSKKVISNNQNTCKKSKNLAKEGIKKGLLAGAALTLANTTTLISIGHMAENISTSTWTKVGLKMVPKMFAMTAVPLAILMGAVGAYAQKKQEPQALDANA